jgi:hypothetical protein
LITDTRVSIKINKEKIFLRESSPFFGEDFFIYKYNLKEGGGCKNDY